MLYVQNNIFKMDSFELNKIIAAILMVALLVIGLATALRRGVAVTDLGYVCAAADV